MGTNDGPGVPTNLPVDATVEWTPQSYDEQTYGWVELRARRHDHRRGVRVDLSTYRLAGSLREASGTSCWK
ncbi:hypothetical protein CA850_16915 [Micromonospora echinospora]|uniref:Uncharacterized protein n=1 Tax=Micromonospora echinospora TaxID=1877 RepID=A0A1C4WV15_MICEC|nr:hypothetical protein [Micromonospora echinospora]OZV79749.1 hypothetical protein CA850_16915 [Micromonospora echinospora]SCF00029.1 hypothetical protein GA0070618_2520 [Micromonospora echinospora]